MRFNIRLSEDFIEGIRLFYSKEMDTKDQKECHGAHDDSPNTHGKQE
jgi:hypothetical protein